MLSHTSPVKFIMYWQMFVLKAFFLWNNDDVYKVLTNESGRGDERKLNVWIMNVTLMNVHRTSQILLVYVHSPRRLPLAYIYLCYPVLTASSNIHHLIQEKRNFQSGSFGVSICSSENGWITRILVVFLVVSFFTELRPNVKKISVCT